MDIYSPIPNTSGTKYHILFIHDIYNFIGFVFLGVVKPKIVLRVEAFDCHVL